MLNLLLASTRPNRFETLLEALSALQPVTLSQASGGHAALERVRSAVVDLIIIDEELGDMAGEELVRRLLKVNAMINTVLVSTASPDDFHERTEGLGILMPLPPTCGETEAIALSQCMAGLGLLNGHQPV